MKEVLPEVYEQFLGVCQTLENHYRDMQDMEFTIEDKKLYMLQTRNGKRTAAAAIKIACDLIDEGMITEEEALMQIDAKSLDMLLHPQFDAAALKKAVPVGKGIAASPGAAAGKIVFTAEEAAERGKAGEKVVLVRLETSPEDIEGMKYAQGILTVRGGQTSHAAVVARGMGTCCVSGCGDIKMDEENKKFTLAGKTLSGKRSDLPGRLQRQHLRCADPDRSGRPEQAATSAASWSWPTNTRRWVSAPTRIRPRTPNRRPPSARRASACAVPSTCSSIPTESALSVK